jgi:Xaa-Pro aminopeptidase
MLIPSEGRARLYVDGRYHIQADQEVDGESIEVCKVSMGGQLLGEVMEAVKGVPVLGYVAERVSCGQAARLSEAAIEAMPLESGVIDEILGLSGLKHIRPIEFVDESIAGRSIALKLNAVFARMDPAKPTALLLCALDDIAWLTEGRAYHFPCQSSFAGVGLATADGVHIAVAKGLMPTERAPQGVTFYEGSFADVLSLPAFDAIEAVFYDPNSATDGLIRQVEALRSDWECVSGPSPLVQERAHKTPAELEHFRSMNRRASVAIAETVRWVREQLKADQAVSEAAFHAAANQNYADGGAQDLSFPTISGIGANSAIIHYGGADANVFADVNDLMLLDSGGLYEGGFCTDTTRTFIAGGAAATPTD